MKFIHLTDPHFIPPGKTLYGRDPRLALDAAVADINAANSDAEMVVITGDLTRVGRAGSLRQSGRLLALTMPVKLLIGNHDHRPTFREHFGPKVDANGFIQSIIETSAGVFIFLDTVLEGTHAGHFCERRCAWLSQTLADVGDRDVFLFMHHPPFATGVAAMDAIGLQQKEAFQAAIHDQQHKIRHLFWPFASPDRRQLAGHSVQHPARDQSSSVAGFQKPWHPRQL